MQKITSKNLMDLFFKIGSQKERTSRMTDGIGDIHKRMTAYLALNRRFAFPKRLTNEAIIDHALCLTTHVDVYDICVVASNNGIIPTREGYGNDGRDLKEFEKQCKVWGTILQEIFPDDIKQPTRYVRSLVRAIAKC
jgi:hypothetical protein